MMEILIFILSLLSLSLQARLLHSSEELLTPVASAAQGNQNAPDILCLSLVLYDIKIGGFHARKESIKGANNRSFLCLEATYHIMA